MKALVLFCLVFNISLAGDFAITAQHGLDYRMETSQIGISYYLSNSGSLEFKIGSSEKEEEDGSELEEQYNISFGYKIRRENNFYIQPEIAYYAFTEDQRTSGFLDLDAEEDYRALAVGVRIGHEWVLWEHFLIGVDWVGAGFGRKLAKFNEGVSNDTPLHYTLLNLRMGGRF